MKKSLFKRVDNECLLCVFSFSNLQDLVSLCLVASEFQRLVSTRDSLWRQAAVPPQSSWRQRFSFVTDWKTQIQNKWMLNMIECCMPISIKGYHMLPQQSLPMVWERVKDRKLVYVVCADGFDYYSCSGGLKKQTMAPYKNQEIVQTWDFKMAFQPARAHWNGDSRWWWILTETNVFERFDFQKKRWQRVTLDPPPTSFAGKWSRDASCRFLFLEETKVWFYHAGGVEAFELKTGKRVLSLSCVTLPRGFVIQKATKTKSRIYLLSPSFHLHIYDYLSKENLGRYALNHLLATTHEKIIHLHVEEPFLWVILRKTCSLPHSCSDVVRICLDVPKSTSWIHFVCDKECGGWCDAKTDWSHFSQRFSDLSPDSCKLSNQERERKLYEFFSPPLESQGDCLTMSQCCPEPAWCFFYTLLLVSYFLFAFFYVTIMIFFFAADGISFLHRAFCLHSATFPTC